MRTTINIDEDMLETVKAIARERRESVGSVVSGLLRKALRPEADIAYEMDVPVFVVREDSPPITTEMVASALEDL